MRARDRLALVVAIGLSAACASPSPAATASGARSSPTASSPGAASHSRTISIETFPDPPRASELLIIVVHGFSPGERASIQVTPGGPATEVRTAVDGLVRSSVILGAAPPTGWTITVTSAGDTAVRSIAPRSESPSALSTPTAVPPQTPTPPPLTDLTVRFTDRVDAAERSEILTDLPIVAAFLRVSLGNDLLHHDEIQVRAGEPAAATNGEVLTSCCNTDARGDVAYFDVAHPDWSAVTPSEPSIPATRLHLLAHEYTHLWQAEQGAAGCFQRPGVGYVAPRWFLEGLAEFVGFMIEVDQGLATQAQVADIRSGNIHRSPVSVRLLEGSSWPSGPDAYGASYAAVVLLAGSAGTASLRGFCERVGNGESWPAAFGHAFGISPDDFYARFELWLASTASLPTTDAPHPSRRSG